MVHEVEDKLLVFRDEFVMCAENIHETIDKAIDSKLGKLKRKDEPSPMNQNCFARQIGKENERHDLAVSLFMPIRRSQQRRKRTC